MMIMSQNVVGIALGFGLGASMGMIAGGILGAIVGAAAAMIIILFDRYGGSRAVYRLSMISVCSSLTAFLVYTQTQWFFDLTRPYDRMAIYALTGLGTFSAIGISFIFANYSRKIFYLPNDDQTPAA